MQNLCFCTDVCPLLPRRAPGYVGQPHKQAWLRPQRDSALGSVSLRPVASLRRRTGGCRDPPRLTQHRPRAASLPPGGSAHSGDGFSLLRTLCESQTRQRKLTEERFQLFVIISIEPHLICY